MVLFQQLVIATMRQLSLQRRLSMTKVYQSDVLKINVDADQSQERLLNVVAHEYCHLANFMISGIKDNPHGKEFKAW